jgi:aromatic ring-opening dioxygenase LigB subunit/uncharacterized protein YdhG (YjbR/CyaY superfamily)
VPHDRAALDPDAPGLVFACIAPHGDLTIPEACPPGSERLASATQAGMAELARRFDAVDPEVVVVLTPHGIHVEGHLAVVTAGHAAGSLEEAPTVSLAVAVDRDLALSMLSELRAAGLPALGVSYGGNDPAEAVFPLDWGTLIPLWYLGGRRDPPTPVVIVAPARDLSPDAHVAAGAAVVRAISASGRRVAIVASADQAHAHLEAGPYGFDPAARAYDERIVTLLRDGRLGGIRDLEPASIEDAKPDSWWQMLMLHGAIGDRWRPEVLSYEVPTYYGMLCAAFEHPATPNERRDAQGGASSVQGYLDALPVERRAAMEQLRATIRNAAPAAEETIAYRMPAFRLGGRFLVSYAAFRAHYSLFPASAYVVDALGRDVEPFLAGKGTIRFPADAPIPLDVVARVVHARLKELGSA